MILVAFVLVLFATVMLIIGTFFDAGTAYIWVSIGACVATFAVLAISYAARRRGADDEAARPAPLAADTSRSAPAARASTVGGGTATMVREETATDTEDADADEPTVTIVPGRDTGAPAGEDEGDDTDSGEAATPAPRRVAPRRVVRKAAPAAGDDEAAPAAAATPATSEDAGDETPAPVPAQPRIVATGARPAPSTGAETPEQDAAPAAEAPARDDSHDTEGEAATAAPVRRTATRKVVRRVAPSSGGGTRKVVRRVAPTGDGTTRKVVRRAPAGGTTTRKVVRRPAEGEDTRTVKRVVRTPAAGSAPTTSAPSTSASSTSSTRTGTRGKRARAVLSEIKGVGPAKQDALLKKFGSLEQMAEASVADLAEIKGVGEAVAAEIKRVLRAR